MWRVIPCNSGTLSSVALFALSWDNRLGSTCCPLSMLSTTLAQPPCFVSNVFDSTAGKRVYVHCRAGHGRSAAAVFAWLLYKDPTVDRKALNLELCKLRNV